MSRTLFLSILAVGATLLASCGGSPPEAPAKVAPAVSDQDGAQSDKLIHWNETAQAFEYQGQELRAAKLWTFDGSTDGFVVMGGDARLTSGAGLQVTQSAYDPILRSPSGLNVDGSVNTLVLVRLTRASAGQAWSGVVHYVTDQHGESAEYMALPVQGENPAVNETTVLVYDMARLKRGGADWTQSIIDQLRFDLEDQPGGEFLVRQVAITNNPLPAP